MKKLNSSSKRKWVLGGALGFAAVALLTTGFATWIIGVNNQAGQGDTQVTVVGTQNKSSELKIGTISDGGITLGETEKISTGVVTSEAVGDLSITIDSITFEYGNDFLPVGHEVKGLKFSLPETTTALGTFNPHDNAANKVNPSNNLLSGIRTAASITGDMYYVTAPAQYDTSFTSSTNSANGLNVATWTNVTLNFSWGNYFNNVSPANFYNSKLEGATTEQVKKVQDELDAMKTALNSKTLTLLVEVVTGAKAAA